MRVMMVSPRFPKGCEAQIGIRIVCKWILTTPLIIMTMVEMMVDSVMKMKEALERALANLEKYLGAKILYAHLSLDDGNVGLKFQFKMLRR